MAKNLTIEIKGMKELTAAFKKSPEIVRAEIDKAIRKALFTIEAKAIPKMPVDRGELRSGNVTKFQPFKGVLTNRAPHAIFIHEGTKPHFPPLHAIERWADRHGISPFLVARAISKKGTKAKPFYDQAVKESKTMVEQIFGKALNEITIKLSK